jgi:hypothetical protein
MLGIMLDMKNEISTKTTRHSTQELGPNYRARRIVAVLGIGAASLLGIKGVDAILDATTDDSREKAAQQAEQSQVEKLNSGQDVGIKTVSYELFSGVKVRKTPVEDNKNSYGDMSDNVAFTVGDDESLIIHNPIVDEKFVNWVGILDPRNNSETKLSYSEDDVVWINIGEIRDQSTRGGDSFMRTINPSDMNLATARLQESGRLDFTHEQNTSVAGEIATGHFMKYGK